MFNKILAAVDGSESSILALDYAAYLANQNTAELKIISAAEPPPILHHPHYEVTTYIPNYQEDLHKVLEETQEKHIKRLIEQYPDLVIIGEVKDGGPVPIIKETAIDADLIVIGHRGLGGILSWVLGSVAKQLVDSCTVPVLVVKNRDYC
jgi:nucleotide-binding universal stress UspA family protein